MAPHSPLASGFVKTHSGTKLRFASFQLRLVAVTSVLTGLGAPPRPPVAPCPATYLLRLTLMAVLPVPNRSYEAPSFGVMSFHPRFDVSGNEMLRVGVRMAGPIVVSPKLLRKMSKRTPPVAVNRRKAHRSCAKNPASASTRLITRNGIDRSVIWLGIGTPDWLFTR